jgi:hypothetical protein
VESLEHPKVAKAKSSKAAVQMLKMRMLSPLPGEQLTQIKKTRVLRFSG